MVIKRKILTDQLTVQDGRWRASLSVQALDEVPPLADTRASATLRHRLRDDTIPIDNPQPGGSRITWLR